MDDRNKHYAELYFAENTNDIGKKIDFFSSMTNCLFELANNPFERRIQIKSHQSILEAKAYRFAFANNSIISLIKGTKVKILDKEINSIDIDSLNSITRMQIETFLILFYLVFDKVEDEIKDFRLNIYKLHALQKQNNFEISADFIDTENSRKKIKLEIEEAIDAIKQSNLFQQANETKKKEYLNPRYAKLIESKQLFERSGIQKSRIDQMWSIYSNYAHSEYISDRQHYCRVINPNSKVETISLILDINKMLTSRLIWNLKLLYNENVEKYDSFDLKDKVHIETWKDI
ncbi:hypothetical protein GCM10008015_27230 [Flavobacterium palustre]|uniref:Uncharacterized protein n=1 Tax=Flavobacterium palustre TaxID=1476463 RepID=A0ABQ1HR99_9FLAO|nr:hypothetical protein [Flavobacterium palustre]GGA84993.1 hypothetical protein GCM10008015_27230 [Flavobacterium palustre]